MVFNLPSVVTSRKRSKYEADLSVSVVFPISSSLDYIKYKWSLNLLLLRDSTSSRYQKVKIKD